MKLNPFKEEAKVALLVDGPNLLRKEFSIDLRELKRRAKKYGRIVVAKVFINQFAPEKLIEAIINEGYECVMVLGENENADTDVSMTVAAMEAILTKDVDIIGIATETGLEEGHSEDAVYYDASDWTEEEQAEAREDLSILEDLGMLGKRTQFSWKEYEYPVFSPHPSKKVTSVSQWPTKYPRNKPCPCGSGKKYQVQATQSRK